MWALISRDVGHSFYAIESNHFTIEGRLTEAFIGSGRSSLVKHFHDRSASSETSVGQVPGFTSVTGGRVVGQSGGSGESLGSSPPRRLFRGGALSPGEKEFLRLFQFRSFIL